MVVESADAWGTQRPSLLASLCIGAIKYKLAHGSFKRPFRNILRAYGRPLDITVRGLKLRCRFGDNHTENSLVEGKTKSDIGNIQRFVSCVGPGDTFVDIGANCGLYSLFAARKVGARGRGVAIEPIPRMAERALFNFESNGLDNVSLVQCAVGAEQATLDLFVNAKQLGKTSSTQSNECSAISVRVMPLLAIVEAQGLDRIDALKIDVEGHEDQVLMPFLSSAPEALWPLFILMEHAHSARWRGDLMGQLAQCGYAVIERTETDTLLRRR
jgi:FkbM family methyltransferase